MMSAIQSDPSGTRRPSARTASTSDSARKRRQRRLKFWLGLLVVLAFLVFAFSPNFIPSESMLPTLRPGDHILTMRAWLAYFGGRNPARGDIITFLLPEEDKAGGDNAAPDALSGKRSKLLKFLRRQRGDILIKRVIGLPGETIQIVESGILINGRKTALPLPQTDRGDALAQGDYAVFRPLQLGPDELFVLGDNADNSEDSRYWGPLKRQNVFGRFVCVLYHEGANGPNAKRARQESGP
jgi:signal peptidase I